MENTDPSELEEINNTFSKLSQNQPLLTLLWCYVLTLVNYNKELFWRDVTKLAALSPLNNKLVSMGSTILYCDFMVRII